jgi:hypothetical protein
MEKISKISKFIFILCSGLLFTISLIYYQGTQQDPYQNLDAFEKASRMKLIYENDFSQPSTLAHFKPAEADLGYRDKSDRGKWEIKDGKLWGEKIYNSALWLQNAILPKDQNIRIEFSSIAYSKEGDTKCEVFGDGINHQSGYIIIAGGWNNRVMAIARQDEHGEDRKDDKRCPQGCLEANREYQWVVERINGTIYWYLNGKLKLKYIDHFPVQGHYFAFNNWSAKVSFDQLKIYEIIENRD